MCLIKGRIVEFSSLAEENLCIRFCLIAGLKNYFSERERDGMVPTLSLSFFNQ